MKNFINISDLSSSELRSIIEEAKSRKIKRQGSNKSAADSDKPFEGKSMAMILKNHQQEQECPLILRLSNWAVLQLF